MNDLRTILYIEDDPDIQAVAKMALETIGSFDVRLCDTGSEAMEVLKGYTPDLILLDVMMPGMDGVSTFRAMRAMAQSRHIPVVFITAKVQKNEIEAYLSIGALGVIEKPFDPMTLAATVRRLWSQHLASKAS